MLLSVLSVGRFLPLKMLESVPSDIHISLANSFCDISMCFIRDLMRSFIIPCIYLFNVSICFSKLPAKVRKTIQTTKFYVWKFKATFSLSVYKAVIYVSKQTSRHGSLSLAKSIYVPHNQLKATLFHKIMQSFGFYIVM